MDRSYGTASKHASIHARTLVARALFREQTGASRKKALSGFRATSDTYLRLSKKHECDR
jgi:hypothetical protein